MPSFLRGRWSAALFLLSCACELGGSDIPPGEPPPPPRPRELPDEVRALLPSNEEGDPIFTRTAWADMDVELAHDPDLDDPIARWGQCLGRVVDCTRTNPTGSVAGCVVQIEPCASPEGGDGCCPQACIDQFTSAYRRTGDDLAALEQSILLGTCVAGFPGEVSP